MCDELYLFLTCICFEYNGPLHLIYATDYRQIKSLYYFNFLLSQRLLCV